MLCTSFILKGTKVSPLPLYLRRSGSDMKDKKIWVLMEYSHIHDEYE
jgi:hypothetical protein